MARTSITPVLCGANNIDLNDAGTAIDASNGMQFSVVTTGVPAAANIDHVLIYVSNSTASTKTVTVVAGANTTTAPNTPAFRAGLGNLVTGNLTASTGTAFIGPLDVSRFIQPDGTVQLNFAASMTGTIWVFLIARAF